MIKSLFKKPEKTPEYTEYKLQISPAVSSHLTISLMCLKHIKCLRGFKRKQVST